MTAAAFSIPAMDEGDLVTRGRHMHPWRLAYAKAALRLDMRTRLSFYRALAVYRRQNIKESAAFTNWWNITTARGQRNLSQPMAILIPVLLYRMHDLGERWQTAFKMWVPQTDALIFSASEHAGLTSGIIDSLIADTLKQRAWARQFREAVFPPLVSAVAIVGILVAAGLVYFPALKKAMPNMRLVGGAADLQSLSDFLVAYGPILAIGLAAAPFIAIQVLRNATGPIRAALDFMPVFASYRQSSGMRFLLGVALLLQSGEKFIDALRILADGATPYARERIDAIIAFDNLRPADAMAATGYHWPDDATIEMLSLYIDQNDPETGIRIVVDDWYDRATERNAALARLASSIGQLVTWSIVGWLYMVSNDIINASTAVTRAAGH